MVTLSELAEQQEREIAGLKMQVEESMNRLDAMFSKNWISIYGGITEQDDGPSLEQLQNASKRIRDQLALNVYVKNGLRVRCSYILRGGIHYAGIPGKARGRGTDVQSRIDNGINQEYFFSHAAREEREAALYSDGIALFIGDSSDYTLRPLSIHEITDDWRNPDQVDEIWAYRHTWNRVTADGKSEVMNEWVFRNQFFDKKPASNRIQYKNETERVAPNKRVFGKPVNSIAGWGYGLPDVLPSLRHAAEYASAMQAGEQMTQAMARILGTYKNNTQQGASDAAVKLGQVGGFGNMAGVGQNGEMNVLASAGNAYKFNDLLAILAQFAAGIGVSVIDLSANPGNAGGSYGAARSLSPVVEAMTVSRRQYHIDLDREVLLWLGASPDKLDVWFLPVIDLQEKYRAEQIAELRLGTGLYEGEEIKQLHAEIDGKNPENVSPVPDGWLIPNNGESLALKSVDRDALGGTAGGNPANGGNFAPTQGSGAATVPSGSGDQDMRRESLSMQGIMESMRMDELLEMMPAFIDAVNKLKE